MTISAHIKRASLIKVSVAAVMLSSIGMVGSAFAAGTLANTDITNTATVNYQVGGVNQTAVNSNASTFKVDRKVDITVTNGAGTTTNPGTANSGIPFTVTNTGNGPDSFTFAAANQTGDQFDVTNMRVYLDNGTVPGQYDASDTLVTAAVPLNPDVPTAFLVVSDIPLAATNTQTSVVSLTATTTSTATAGADNPNAVDVVFADAGNDGTESDTNVYTINSATLSVVKSASIISDPVNGTGANRKAIPGAVIEYSIVVTNSGGTAATSVTLSDNIPANTTYVPASMTLNAAALTDAADADAGTFASNAVSVAAGTVASGGGTATVTFRVTLN